MGRAMPPGRAQKSWRMPVMDAPTATLLGGLAVGLGLAFHGFFFFLALLVFAAWAAPHAFRFAHHRSSRCR